RNLAGLPHDAALEGTIADGAVLAEPSSGIRPTARAEIAIAVETGPDSGRVLPLGDEPVSIGRARDDTIAIADPGGSRHQLVARYDPSGLTLTPVAATNPLRVDGAPTVEPVTLAAGQLLTIGSTGLRIVTAAGFGRPEPPPPSPGRGGGNTVLNVPAAPDPPRPRSL